MDIKKITGTYNLLFNIVCIILFALILFIDIFNVRIILFGIYVVLLIIRFILNKKTKELIKIEKNE